MEQTQTTVSMEYNSRRQRSSLNDPNYGLTTYTYSPFDELTAQVSPKGQTTSYSYDVLGRLVNRTTPEGQTQWIYNYTPGRLGTLKTVQGPGHHTAYSFDDYLRPKTITETIHGTSYQTHYTYDAIGREETTTYPSGFATRKDYNSRGYLRRIRALNNNILWQADNTNALGLLTEYQTGNGLTTTISYETVTNRLSGIHTLKTGQDPIQHLEYTWYDVGNLKQRSSKTHNLYEYFTYDDLNRLETIRLNGTIRGEHQYDPAGLGNLVYKKADGHILFDNAAYGENTAGPHALTSAETSPGVFPPEQQSIVYNSFDKLVSITEGDHALQIIYGHHRQRIIQQYSQGQNTIEKVWAGTCEYITENGQTTTLTYLSSPDGVFALHIKNPNGTENIRYIHKDHLGSWHTITDESGNLLQELSFDAWGNRRNPATWRAFTGTPTEPLFDRGFTGHEHLYGFQLINMNGRMYDPVVSRMLSPDNFIQAPEFSQSFNRYSYVWNNPLVLTDPSGEIALAFLGLAFTTEYLSNGINGYGWDAGKAYSSATATTSEINSGLQFSIYQSGNTTVTAGIDPFAFGNSANVYNTQGNVTMSFGVSYGIMSGLSANTGVFYSTSDVNISIGGGVGRNAGTSYYSVGGSLSIYEYGAGYAYTHYGAGTVPQGGQAVGSQNTGSPSVLWPGGSFRIENDFLSPRNLLKKDNFDRWRTSAWELTIGDYSIGSYIYTNDPGDETIDHPKNRKGMHRFGEVYSSPLWLGYRVGNTVSRIGFSHRFVQHVTQNLMVHRYGFLGLSFMGTSPDFGYYNSFYTGPYLHSGYYNPYTLYGR